VISASRPPSVQVAGWTISLLELDALHAPLRWVDPRASEDELAWLPCHGLLCRREDEVLLVDCGLGVFHDFFDLEVRLTTLDSALEAAGCSAGEVTTVVLTHLDPDHSGGVVVGSSPDALAPAFPGMRVALLDVLLEPGADVGEHAERVLGALAAGGAPVEGIADGGEVTAGVRLRSAPGHRLGHACLDLSSRGERFVFLADVVHAREHVEQPEWDREHDSDPAVALATRRDLLAEVAGTSAIVGCSHIDGLGRIVAGPRWIDLE
jgi:glyoxylase-like metal-dependent hydrolase (beta-lactamase superfamily II)